MNPPAENHPADRVVTCPFCGHRGMIAEHFQKSFWTLIEKCDVGDTIPADWLGEPNCKKEKET